MSMFSQNKSCQPDASKWTEALSAVFRPSGDSTSFVVDRCEGFINQEDHAFAREGEKQERKSLREQGIALIVALTAVSILSIMMVEIGESSSTAFAVSVYSRDQVQAEYMAKSGLNLTRLLVQKEPEIRRLVNPFFRGVMKRNLPQLPVWNFANHLLWPFCDVGKLESSSGFDFSNVEGLGETPARCEVIAVPENAKINVNSPLSSSRLKRAQEDMARQLYSMTGGYLPESQFDILFSERDSDGNFTNRLDVISSLIDWWDVDTTRTTFDPGSNEISEGGIEDDIYTRLDDPYKPKNAPLDSIEELRLIRGFSDDFWATFIETRPDDPRARTVTIYDSGEIHINDAPAEVLLARLCAYVPETTLCADPLESAKFIQLLNTVRSIFPIPFFASGADLVKFVSGQGGANDLYPMLQGFLGEGNPLLFLPIVVPNEVKKDIEQGFSSKANILTIQSTGMAGRADRPGHAKVRIRAVVNFHPRWVPPPPNSGTMPGLGVVQHYRVD